MAQLLPRKWAIKRYFTFPPHIISASGLLAESENPESASLHFSAACFYQKHTKHIKLSPCCSWTTRHCQKDWLGAPDRTSET